MIASKTSEANSVCSCHSHRNKFERKNDQSWKAFKNISGTGLVIFIKWQAWSLFTLGFLNNFFFIALYLYFANTLLIEMYSSTGDSRIKPHTHLNCSICSLGLQASLLPDSYSILPIADHYKTGELKYQV